MTQAELNDLLKQVRMRGSTYNSSLLLNDEQIAAISRVLLPAISARIKQAGGGVRSTWDASGPIAL